MLHHQVRPVGSGCEHRHLFQFRQRPLRSPHSLGDDDLPVFQPQDWLHRQRRPDQRGRGTDPPPAPEVLQCVHVEQQRGAFDRVERGVPDLVRRGTGLGCGRGLQHRGAQPHGDRPRVDDGHRPSTRRRSQQRRLVGPGERRRQVNRHDRVDSLGERRLVGLAE
jgi:hypothetical protein